MAAWEMKIITAEAQRLMELAADDLELRADLRRLALEILAATENLPPRSRLQYLDPRDNAGARPRAAPGADARSSEADPAGAALPRRAYRG